MGPMSRRVRADGSSTRSRHGGDHPWPSHPKIMEAIRNVSETLDQLIFANLTRAGRATGLGTGRHDACRPRLGSSIPTAVPPAHRQQRVSFGRRRETARLFSRSGLLVRPLGNGIYIIMLPCYVTSEELDRLHEAIDWRLNWPATAN